jgi:hypothetical protein
MESGVLAKKKTNRLFPLSNPDRKGRRRRSVLSGNGRLDEWCRAIAALVILLEPIFGHCKVFQFHTSDFLEKEMRVSTKEHIPGTGLPRIFLMQGAKPELSVLDIHSI